MKNKNSKDYYLTKKTQIRETKSAKRIFIKDETKLQSKMDYLKGQVIIAQGRIFFVKMESGELYECIVSGALKSENHNSTPVAVGDYVKVVEKNNIGETELPLGAIIEVEKRKGRLSRKMVGKTDVEQVIASNIDTLVIFSAAIDPPYNRRLIDRFLVLAEQNELEPIIVINKVDLVDLESFDFDFDTYLDLGIEVHFISMVEKTGIEELMHCLEGKTSALSGPSGVGKSSFINMISNLEEQVTTEVSKRTNKGMHTTSFVKMFEINSKTKIIDSPGIRELALNIDFEKEDLSLFFHDFDEYRVNCKHRTCTHTHEPVCAVRQAVEDEEIDYQRYASYINIYESL
jgi:ribosome biogenesis GTPase